MGDLEQYPGGRLPGAVSSYNHYAFGCIGDWMSRNILGIRRLAPGYQRILIAPDFDLGLEHAQGKFESVYEALWR